jgi:hypothetical protein
MKNEKYERWKLKCCTQAHEVWYTKRSLTFQIMSVAPEPYGSSSYLQEPATGSYAEPTGHSYKFYLNNILFGEVFKYDDGVRC